MSARIVDCDDCYFVVNEFGIVLNTFWYEEDAQEYLYNLAMNNE